MPHPSNNAAASTASAATADKPAEAGNSVKAGKHSDAPNSAKPGKHSDAPNSAKPGSPAETANAAKAGDAAKPARGFGLARRLRLRVGTEGARADLLAGWRVPQLEASQQIEYRPGIATLPEAIAALDPLLTSLAAAAGPIKGLPCDVLIGDAWMLYDVVRADLRTLSPRAADDVVRSALADVAGVPPSEVVTRWCTQSGGHCTVTCGMPTAVLPSLQALLRTHRLQVGEVVGEFVHEYNAHRDRLVAGCAVISLVREAGTQLAVASNGVLTAMSFELGVRAPEELEARGRSLVRGAGITLDADTRFFALLPSGWTPPSPWVAVSTTP